MDHQIRIAHVRKRARNRLDKIEGWDWIKARMWRLLTDLPPDGGLEIPRLERAVRDSDSTLRRMRVELSGKRRAPLCRRRRRDVPRTNNAAERATGGSEIRRKTVRGRKSEDGMLNGFGLTHWALERSGRLGHVGDGRGATPRPPPGNPRSPKTVPKSPTVSGTVTPRSAIGRAVYDDLGSALGTMDDTSSSASRLRNSSKSSESVLLRAAKWASRFSE